MTIGDKIVKQAKSYIGKYKKHKNIFTKHFKGKYGVNKKGYYPKGYCTLYVMRVFDDCGILNCLPVKALGKNASNVQYLYAYLKKHGKIITDPKKAKAGMPAFKKVGDTKKKKPGHSAIFLKYENGKVYTIDGNVGGGVKIRKKSPIWYLGFGDVLPKSKAAKPKEPSGKPATTRYMVSGMKKGSHLRVRKDPNTKSKILTNLQLGALVDVSKIKGGWAYIPKLKGWCSARYLKKI